jgi:hypothetical protein
MPGHLHSFFAEQRFAFGLLLLSGALALRFAIAAAPAFRRAGFVGCFMLISLWHRSAIARRWLSWRPACSTTRWAPRGRKRSPASFRYADQY